MIGSIECGHQSGPATAPVAQWAPTSPLPQSCERRMTVKWLAGIFALDSLSDWAVYYNNEDRLFSDDMLV